MLGLVIIGQKSQRQIVEVNVNKTKSLTTMAPSLRLYLHSVFLAVDMLLKSFSCFCYHQKAFSNVQMLFALVHHAEFQSKVPDHHGHQLYIMDGWPVELSSTHLNGIPWPACPSPPCWPWPSRRPPARPTRASCARCTRGSRPPSPCSSSTFKWNPTCIFGRNLKLIFQPMFTLKRNHTLFMNHCIGKSLAISGILELVNVWFFVQLIHRPMRIKKELYKNPNIA